MMYVSFHRIYVCTYVRMYICIMYAYIIHIYMHIYTGIHTYVSECVCMYGQNFDKGKILMNYLIRQNVTIQNFFQQLFVCKDYPTYGVYMYTLLQKVKTLSLSFLLHHVVSSAYVY